MRTRVGVLMEPIEKHGAGDLVQTWSVRVTIWLIDAQRYLQTDYCISYVSTVELFRSGIYYFGASETRS